MAQGPHSEIISSYFMHMKSLLLEGLVIGDILAINLKKTTSKALYAGFTSSFPPPKIEYKYNID